MAASPLTSHKSQSELPTTLEPKVLPGTNRNERKIFKPAKLSFQAPDKSKGSKVTNQSSKLNDHDDNLFTDIKMSDKKNKHAPDDVSTTNTADKDRQLSYREQEEIREMMQLAPYVLDILYKNGISNVFLLFFRQVHQDSNVVNNIAFLLWTEVVKWYNHSTSTRMRYMHNTKMFWKLGWQLFGGKFLRFMSGYKNKTQVVSGQVEKGMYHPEKSDVNFAVPEQHVLREFKPYGDDLKGIRKPGIFDDVIKKISPTLHKTSCCLTFDGKKIKQGLTETSGDIDILGFEDGPSLNDRLKDLNSALEKHQAVLDKLISPPEEDDQQFITGIITDLKLKYITISKYIQEINQIKEKKTYALKKFMELVARTGDKTGLCT